MPEFKNKKYKSSSELCEAILNDSFTEEFADWLKEDFP